MCAPNGSERARARAAACAAKRSSLNARTRARPQQRRRATARDRRRARHRGGPGERRLGTSPCARCSARVTTPARLGHRAGRARRRGTGRRAPVQRGQQLVERRRDPIGVDREHRADRSAAQRDPRRRRSRRSGPCRRASRRTADRRRAAVSSSTLAGRRSAARARSTWLPNVPASPWFLPWMSLAIAPPTDTCWVPGTTGTIQPAGTSRVEQLADRRRPAPAVDDPGVGVELDPASGAVVRSRVPPSQLGGVAVAAPHARGRSRRRGAAASCTARQAPRQLRRTRSGRSTRGRAGAAAPAASRVGAAGVARRARPAAVTSAGGMTTECEQAEPDQGRSAAASGRASSSSSGASPSPPPTSRRSAAAPPRTGRPSAAATGSRRPRAARTPRRVREQRADRADRDDRAQPRAVGVARAARDVARPRAQRASDRPRAASAAGRSSA